MATRAVKIESPNEIRRCGDERRIKLPSVPFFFIRFANMQSGQTWIIDAHGCRPAALRSRGELEALLNNIVKELKLSPIGKSSWHEFPEPGGVTGFLLLSESHLSIHTFPELRFAAIDLYCCRDIPEWNWTLQLERFLGAERVAVHRIARGHYK